MGGSAGGGLLLDHVTCGVCGSLSSEPIGVGEDFEYRTSADYFLAVRCNDCSLVYLDPRPSPEEFDRIYPDNYHAFDFVKERFGLVYKVRQRLEARRLLGAARGVSPRARVLDIGCGDGFHLELLREHGPRGWELEGIDLDKRAVDAARQRGLNVHLGSIQDLDLDEDAYDVAFLIQTIEHVVSPAEVLAAALRVLRPGGRLIVVTDNTNSPDFTLFKKRYWGGYHFPRHLNLFNRRALGTLAREAGFEVGQIRTIVSPVNWTYSVRNMLQDLGAPSVVVDRFSLESAPALAVFTVVDFLWKLGGRAALLQARLDKPAHGFG